MISQEARFDMIAAVVARRARPLSAVALPALLPVTEGEVVESVHIELDSRAAQNDESIVESEYNTEPSTELVSRLGHRARDVEKTVHERDYMLSETERREASDDLWRFRHPVEMWLAPITLFHGHEARLTA